MLPQQPHKIAAAAANVQHRHSRCDVERRRDAESVLVGVRVSVGQSACVLLEFGLVPAEPGGIPSHLPPARQTGITVSEESRALVGAEGRVWDERDTEVGGPVQGVVVRLPRPAVLPNTTAEQRCNGNVSPAQSDSKHDSDKRYESARSLACGENKGELAPTCGR